MSILLFIAMYEPITSFLIFSLCIFGNLDTGFLAHFNTISELYGESDRNKIYIMNIKISECMEKYIVNLL